MKRLLAAVTLVLCVGVAPAVAAPTYINDGQINPAYKTQFLRTSTGSLKANFGLQFLQSSTGSLRTLFNSLYFQSSTGSLANAFKSIFLASSTGALKANFGSQFIQSSTGALKANFGLQFVQSSTGALQTKFDGRYVQNLVAGQGLVLVGTNSFKVGSSLSGASLRFLTDSASTVFARNNLFASGTLVVRGTQAQSVFKVDNTNARVGINQSSPEVALDVGGTMSGGLLTIMRGSSYFLGNISIGSATINNPLSVNGFAEINSTKTAATALEVNGTISGSTIRVTNGLNSINGVTTVSGSTSIRNARVTRYIAIPLCDGVTACAVGTGSMVQVPSLMDRMSLSGSLIGAYLAGTTNSMKVQVRNVTQAKDLFSTQLTLQTGQKTGSGVINTSNAVLNVNDILVPFISAVSTTPAKGATITLIISP